MLEGAVRMCVRATQTKLGLLLGRYSPYQTAPQHWGIQGSKYPSLSLLPPARLLASLSLNSGSLLSSQKPVLKRQVLVGTEKSLYSGGQQTGKMANLCPKTNSEDSARPWKFLKGESFGEEFRVFIYLPLCADFLLIGWWWGKQGCAPGILGSGWSYHPPPGRGP